MSVHTGGGGGTYLPRSEWGGVPGQVWMGGVPGQVWTGGVPGQVWMGGRGYLGWGGGGTWPGGGRGVPGRGEGGGYLAGGRGVPGQKECLLCSGRYASCVHAGRLSCLMLKRKVYDGSFFLKQIISAVQVSVIAV